MDLNDLKSVKINQLNGVISEKKKSVKTEYDQLMVRIKLLQKQMDEYTILQSNIDEIIKIVNMPMKTISLLKLISENNTIADILSLKMENLTLQEVVGDVDVETWINSKKKIIKKDINNSNFCIVIKIKEQLRTLRFMTQLLKQCIFVKEEAMYLELQWII